MAKRKVNFLEKKAESRLLKDDNAGPFFVGILFVMLAFFLAAAYYKNKEKQLESVGIYDSEIRPDRIYAVIKDDEVIEKLFLSVEDARKYTHSFLNPFEYKIFILKDYLDFKLKDSK